MAGEGGAAAGAQRRGHGQERDGTQRGQARGGFPFAVGLNTDLFPMGECASVVVHDRCVDQLRERHQMAVQYEASASRSTGWRKEGHPLNHPTETR
jgi:hypothetical protein